MKTILLTALLFLSIGVMAQTKTTTFTEGTTFKIDSLTKWSMSGTGTEGISRISPPKSNWSQYWRLNVDYKPIMIISDQKPDSTYHIWIDKKAITWTSDSTFILKRKP